jgi:hypothetical protein
MNIINVSPIELFLLLAEEVNSLQNSSSEQEFADKLRGIGRIVDTTLSFDTGFLERTRAQDKYAAGGWEGTPRYSRSNIAEQAERYDDMDVAQFLKSKTLKLAVEIF